MTQEGVVKYPKIQALHYVENLIPSDAHVVVQEKLDGSNVAILKLPDGTLQLQSRETIIDVHAPGMFKPFVDWVSETRVGNDMSLGDIWYGEMVSNQGKIKYDEKNPFVLFDCGRVLENGSVHFSFAWKDIPEFVPRVRVIALGSWGEFRSDLPAYLQGLPDKSEGVVAKAYAVMTHWTDEATGERCSMYLPLVGAKLVREDFKEMKAGKTNLKGADDPLTAIAGKYITPARVRKAFARIAERGDDPTKGHLVIQSVLKDIHDEETEGIKNDLFAAYWKKINNAAPKLILELHAKQLSSSA